VLGLALLCLLLATYGLFAARLASVAVMVDYDPALQYLIASLAPFSGGSYAYVDHPGTPVEVLGSLVLAALRPFVENPRESFVLTVVRHPEWFLQVADCFLVSATIAACAALAYWSVRGSGRQQAMLALACAGLYFAIHPLAVDSVALWSHNSFNLIGGSMLSLALVAELRRNEHIRCLHTCGLGFGAGILTAVQLYFGAWIVGVVVALVVYEVLLGASKWYALLVGFTALIASIVGFGVATLPIADQYAKFGLFALRIAVNQDLYGHGPTGVPSPERWWSNLRQLMSDAPVLFAAMIIVSIGLVWRLRSDHVRLAQAPGRWAASIGLVAQMLLLLVLIVKHPRPIYLLSIAATLPLLGSLTVESLDQWECRRWWLAPATLGVVVSLLLFNFQSAVLTRIGAAQTVERSNVVVQAALDGIATARGIRPDELVVLWTYGTNNGCYARWFADGWPIGIATAEIGLVCPNDRDLDVWQRTESAPTGAVPLQPDESWDAIIVPEDILSTYPWLQGFGDGITLDAKSLGFGRLVLIINYH
jgi:hypothetical protein